MSIYPDEGVFFLNIGVKLRFDRAEMPRWKCRPTTSSSSRGQIIRTPIKPSRFDWGSELIAFYQTWQGGHGEFRIKVPDFFSKLFVPSFFFPDFAFGNRSKYQKENAS